MRYPLAVCAALFAVTLEIMSAPSLKAQADINLTGYTQTFSDEFNTLSATTSNPKGASKWYALPAYGSAGYFSASNWNIGAFSVSGGILSDTAYWVSPAVGGQNWQSGILSSVDPTKAGFSQTYGYFEIRCQMPNAGTGSWPSFWLDSLSGISAQQNEEIDVFEWYGVCNTPGSYQAVMQQASHNWNSDGSQNQTAPYLYVPQTPMPGGAYPWQGYHIYGVQIDPVHVTWYIDGVQTNQIATPTAYINTPFYLMVDYALGGGWSLSGQPYPAHGSSAMLVDWVRVYSLPSGGTTYALTVNSGSGSGTYSAGTAVTVTANAPAGGYHFVTWTGATGALANPNASSTTLTMPAAATSITATYAANTTYALTVNSGTGSGSYSAGTVVNVTANAAPTGYHFATWTGATGALANPSAASTTLTMPAAATSITATYAINGSGTTPYQDAFSRSGEFNASIPSPNDTGGATWTSTVGNGAYSDNGSVVTISSTAYPYNAVFLPVNGTSSVVLDGTKDFTLSVVVTSGGSGIVGVSLNMAGGLSGSGGNLFSSNLATVAACTGYSAYAFNTGAINYVYSAGITGATTVSIAYSAAAHTLTYKSGSNTLGTQSGVTAAQIASVRAVALGDHGYGNGQATAPAPTFDNFTLTVSP